VLKRLLWTASVVCLAVAAVLPAQAASPIKIGTVAPIEDFAAEAEAKVKALEEALKDETSYTAAKKKTIPEEAGILAVLAQAIAEHDGEAAWKAAAPDARDAAMALAKAGSLADAKKALEDVKAAMGGKKGSAKLDHAWEKLTNLDTVMSEVNKRTGKLRRAVRKLPDDTAQAARDASVLALMGVVTHEDTHEVKDKSKVDGWKKFCVDMQVDMTELSKQFKAKDAAKAKAAFEKANKSCSGCHEQYRDA
jgi:hypothetical protein